MDHQRNGVAPGDGVGLFQELGGAEIRGMGFHGDGDEGFPAPFVDQPLGVGQTGLGGTVIGGGEVVEDLPHHGSQAGLVGGLGHGIFEKVHVTKTGGAERSISAQASRVPVLTLS